MQFEGCFFYLHYFPVWQSFLLWWSNIAIIIYNINHSFTACQTYFLALTYSLYTGFPYMFDRTGLDIAQGTIDWTYLRHQKIHCFAKQKYIFWCFLLKFLTNICNPLMLFCLFRNPSKSRILPNARRASPLHLCVADQTGRRSFLVRLL